MADDRESLDFKTQFSEGAEIEEYLEDHLQPARYREIRRRENLQQDFKMKVDLPNLSGKLDVETFLDWFKNVEESFFEYMETVEDNKVKMVALKLKSDAWAWWDQVQVHRRLIGKTPIRNWPRRRLKGNGQIEDA